MKITQDLLLRLETTFESKGFVAQNHFGSQIDVWDNDQKTYVLYDDSQRPKVVFDANGVATMRVKLTVYQIEELDEAIEELRCSVF
ncbi:MAG: hypothetical protein QS2022_3270 [Candidatus Phytoplasma asteris]|uniref:Uncharacterized protein n=1 Tax='Chrysanthemum coronarium' phytoplasma TaxID=1520703 RepID=A0ABQ0J251_9MOLU|nr:hypothetical protein ['Chrysanthemum coronarium' phytoplasma]TKA88083.1 MAG: hypothetical protein PLY_3260 [Periwinkle leaf yellowing phytoplasma]WEX19583.1 MAG: hypothetical protein QS2022_3270 [Candidatus Phytoplasma asteris]GAK73680.1 uncharacterized protein OYV_01590 ['Chrysanthemum coronarium' phytoplasma]